MVQELMCGQRRAPMLQLTSRLGGNRRVVACLPEIVDGGAYSDGGRGNDSAFPRKSSIYYCAPRPGQVSDAPANPQVSGLNRRLGTASMSRVLVSRAR